MYAHKESISTAGGDLLAALQELGKLQELLPDLAEDPLATIKGMILHAADGLREIPGFKHPEDIREKGG